MSTAPTKPMPPRPPPRQALAAPPTPADGKPSEGFTVSSGILAGPQRIGVYGPGSVGKSTLCSLLKSVGKKPLVLDLDDGSKNLDVDRVEGQHLLTWDKLRASLRDPQWTQFDTVVIDSVTKAEDLAATDILQKANVDSLEKADGGYGKGYRSLYERMLLLLSDLDGHVRKGRNVILVMHDCVARCPNPSGPDYIRFEPRLYASDKISVRHRVKEWLDSLLFLNFDVIAKDGKAKGGNSRTIWPQEQPHFMAKSRTLREPIVFDEGSAELWNQLFPLTP